MSEIKQMRYFGAARPHGWLLCHNHVQHEPKTKHGDNGFRVFYLPTSVAKRLHFVRCPCGWRDDLGPHHANREHVASYKRWSA